MIFNAIFTMLIPLRVPMRQDRYYLYPYNITVCAVFVYYYINLLIKLF